MTILSTKGWDDYELLDSGFSKRLERFGKYFINRPDPDAIWKTHLEKNIWDKADAIFSSEDKKWIVRNNIPEKWLLSYKSLSFFAKLTPFKHTGIFPEQIAHWDFIEDKIKNAGRTLNILNLFAYTGIASLICAKNGAKITHVDASKPSISWAKENQTASKLSDSSIRWILDDALTFVKREEKRGTKYDAIIMDPPVYGHSPEGKKWEFVQDFPELLKTCRNILSNNPELIIINAYAVSSSSLMLHNMLEDAVSAHQGNIESGELALEEKTRNRFLSTGIFARWTK